MTKRKPDPANDPALHERVDPLELARIAAAQARHDGKANDDAPLADPDTLPAEAEARAAEAAVKAAMAAKPHLTAVPRRCHRCDAELDDEAAKHADGFCSRCAEHAVVRTLYDGGPPQPLAAVRRQRPGPLEERIFQQDGVFDRDDDFV